MKKQIKYKVQSMIQDFNFSLLNPKYILITAIFFLIGETAFSQSVGINSTGTAPNTSAMLDVDASNKGMLNPRVSLTSTTDATTIPSPATSLLVYNSNASMTNGGIGFGIGMEHSG